MTDLIKTKRLMISLVVSATVLSLGREVYAASSQASVKKSTATLSQKQTKNNRFTYDFSFYSKAAGYSEGEDESSLVLFGVKPTFKFKLAPQFTVDASLLLNLSASRVQSRYLNQTDQDFVLNDLSLNYKPNRYMKISGGALNQGHLNAPQLVSSISFPGVLGEVFYQEKRMKFGYKGQRTIPVSQSFDSDRTDKEELPYFQTHGLFGKFIPFKGVFFDAQVNYFSFTNLPSVVAFESRRLGNDVTGVEVGDSFFVNKYSGLAQSYKLRVRYNRDCMV